MWRRAIGMIRCARGALPSGGDVGGVLGRTFVGGLPQFRIRDFSVLLRPPILGPGAVEMAGGSYGRLWS